jgi:hypothetical protein
MKRTACSADAMRIALNYSLKKNFPGNIDEKMTVQYEWVTIHRGISDKWVDASEITNE